MVYNKLCKTLDCWSRDTLNFDFMEKGLGIVFPTHFVYDFSRKIYHIIFYRLTKFLIVGLPLLFKILGSMCIAILCKRGWDDINFENNLILYGCMDVTVQWFSYFRFEMTVIMDACWWYLYTYYVLLTSTKV